MTSAGAFRWFIRAFIQKERQERWLSLLGRDCADPGLSYKGWSRTRKSVGQLERHLDRRFCTLIERGGWEPVQKELERKKLTEGVLVTFSFCDPLDPSLDPLPDPRMVGLSESDGLLGSETLLVCESHRRAFYFHHEYWVWSCLRPLSR